MTTDTLVPADLESETTLSRWPEVWIGVVGVGSIVTLLGAYDPVRGFGIALVLAVLSMLTIFSWRREGRSGAVFALAIGVIGVSIGIGLGLRWLSAGVVTPTSVLATLLLVASLGLVWLGLRRTLRGMRLLGRVGLGSLLVLTSALAVLTLAPGWIATNVPPTDHDDLPLLPGGEAVSFPTDDGVELWAWYVPPLDGRVVVLRHGAGSNATDVQRHAEVLVRAGYGVILTDARGHGSSGGRAMDFGWNGNSDIAAAVSFLENRPGVDPSQIAVVGMSMGGEEAIGAMGSDPRIAAVVAEGATARTDDDKVWLVDEYGWRGWLQLRLEWIQYWFTGLLTAAEQPQSLAEAARDASPRPILMISAGSVPDEAKAAAYVAEGTDNVTTWDVAGAGHIGGIDTASDEWAERVLTFLSDALSS